MKRKIIAVFTALTVITGASAAKCASGDSGTGSGGTGVRGCDSCTADLKTVQFTGDTELIPYEVLWVVTDAKTGRFVKEGGGPVARGAYDETFGYHSGTKLNVELTVKPHKPGSTKGYCRIIDGVDNVSYVAITAGGWTAHCHITTKH